MFWQRCDFQAGRFQTDYLETHSDLFAYDDDPAWRGGDTSRAEHLMLDEAEAPQQVENVKYQHADYDEALGTAEGAEGGAQAPASAGPKVGRNDPCPCGSGKKYKHCHGTFV